MRIERIELEVSAAHIRVAGCVEVFGFAPVVEVRNECAGAKLRDGEVVVCSEMRTPIGARTVEFGILPGQFSVEMIRKRAALDVARQLPAGYGERVVRIKADAAVVVLPAAGCNAGVEAVGRMSHSMNAPASIRSNEAA